MLDIVVVRILDDIAHLLISLMHSLMSMMDRILGLVHGIAGLMLHAIDIAGSALGGLLHHIPGEAAQSPHPAHVLAGLILQQIAQPFLLHADQAGKPSAGLKLVQHRAVAFQAQIHETQAFIFGKDAHAFNQGAPAFRGLRQALAELGNSLVGIGGILGIAHGRPFGFVQCDKTVKAPAIAEFPAGSKTFYDALMVSC